MHIFRCVRCELRGNVISVVTSTKLALIQIHNCKHVFIIKYYTVFRKTLHSMNALTIKKKKRNVLQI